MKQSEIKIHKFSNGITLLGEEVLDSSSVAFSILVPVGAANEPAGLEGLASVQSDMFLKGAAEYDVKNLSIEFETIGAQTSVSSGVEATQFSCAILPENLSRAVQLFAKLSLEPTFPESELESVRQLALQDLKGVEDAPSRKVMIELNKNYFPKPFNVSSLGTESGLKQIDIAALKSFYKERFVPNNAIIGIAGKFDWAEVLKIFEDNFSGWEGESSLLDVSECVGSGQSHHIEKETNQVQIAFAIPSVTYGDADYYAAKVAVGVLSGGMSGRLFIEVREKRGLVYSVYASHNAARGRAGVYAYAGTTPDNAEQTFQVMRDEFNKLRKGVSDDELKRAKADIKSRIVMQSELSSSRAGILVNDWWNLKRVRGLVELKDEIDKVSSDDIVNYIKNYPANPITLVTLGPKGISLEKV